MKKILLLLLLFYKFLYSQPYTNNQESFNQFDYSKPTLIENNNFYKDNLYRNPNEPIVFVSGEPYDHFGISVASAGDVNGDGYLDIIVGAEIWPFRAYIYYGSALMDNIVDVTLSISEDTTYSFGNPVSSAGDVNGDGYSDIIIGASDFNSAYLFYGGPEMDNIVDVIFSNFGSNGSSAGDVNGDGYSDILINSNLFFGGITINQYPDIVFGNSGFSTSAGDLNEDGYSDVIVGQNIYLGGSNMNNIVDVILSINGNPSSAGDVNGDGYSDIIIGSSNIAFIYFGGINMDNIIDVYLQVGDSSVNYGSSVSTAGDINGDGYSDIIVGDRGYNLYQGRVYIYYGGSSMDSIVDEVKTGEDNFGDFGSAFGCSVSSFENGSGIIVGAFGGPWNGGKAFLYRYYSTEPVLIYPSKNSDFNPLDINFKWSKFNSAIYYVLDVSTNSSFMNLIVSDTIYIDTSKIVSGFQKDTKYFWRVRAKDTSGVMINSLTSNFTTLPPIYSDIKLLFEGMYSPFYNQLIRKDSITAYLRSSSSPFALVDSSKTYIDTISHTGSFKFFNALSGTYYISLHHLNSVETWSKSGGEYFTNDRKIYIYDFTSSKSQAYGNNLILKGSKYCLYSGDVNQDGYINLSDVIPINNDASNFITGRYLVADLTGDNIVDLTDVSICYNNASNFVAVIRP